MAVSNQIKWLTKLIIVLFWGLPTSAALPLDLNERLQSLLQTGLEQDRFIGISIVVMDKSGDFTTLHYGHRDQENEIPPNDYTLYELGSITKPFARIALANQDQIQLDDTIEKYLPSVYRAPKPGGESVRIKHLLNHTGIRYSVPCTVRAANPTEPICFGFEIDPDITDPYSQTTRESLYQFINEFSFTIDDFPDAFSLPGDFYSYSNVGSGLIGEFLGQENGVSFEEYLASSVLHPLGMFNSFIDMPCDQTDSCENLAKVYTRSNSNEPWRKVQHWHMPGMSSAGGLRSNIKDMSIFLNNVLNPEFSTLKSAFSIAESPMHELTDQHQQNICGPDEEPYVALCNQYPKSHFYGWEAIESPVVFYHGGGTGGSQAMIMFSADHSDGVIVLSNSSFRQGENTINHYPNDVALCVYQLLGKPLTTAIDFCAAIADKI